METFSLSIDTDKKIGPQVETFVLETVAPKFKYRHIASWGWSRSDNNKLSINVDLDSSHSVDEEDAEFEWDKVYDSLGELHDIVSVDVQVRVMDFSNKHDSSICKACSKPLVKQWVDRDMKPYNAKYDPNANIINFGKHQGKTFEELTKRQIHGMLEHHIFGQIVSIRHPETYCNLHRFADGKWPEWLETLCLWCDCRWGKLWSCPEHGVL